MNDKVNLAENEMFLVIEGQLRIELRDRAIDLSPGEFYIVPRGVEHKPITLTPLVHAVLFESTTTRNTGDVDHEFSIEADQLERI